MTEPTPFDRSTIDAVLAHMNGDHADDNLVIARAFGRRDAETAIMTGLDRSAGQWEFTVGPISHCLSVTWEAPVLTRQDIRREVIAVFERACDALDVSIPGHP